MLIVILILIIGVAVVYISQFNFMPVTVNLGFHVFSRIPLFYVIVGSLLLGLALSYVAYLIHAISSSIKLRGKDREINREKAQTHDLAKRVRQLEAENEKLKKASAVVSGDKRYL